MARKMSGAEEGSLNDYRAFMSAKGLRSGLPSYARKTPKPAARKTSTRKTTRKTTTKR